MKEVTSKFFMRLYHLRVLSLLEFKVLQQVQNFSQKQRVESNHTHSKSYQTCEKG